VSLNTQLQEKEKKYFDLYEEKMMMEETLIRETANKKAGTRTYNAAPTLNKPTGPPVSFINPVKQTEAEANSDASIFSFGEDGKPGERKASGDETSGDSTDSKTDSEGKIKKKPSLTSPAETPPEVAQIKAFQD